jgi:hypothetical protein
MTAAMRSRLLIRVRDCAAYRSKKVSEGPGFRRGYQGEHGRPDDHCAERLFHEDIIAPDTCHARVVIRIYDDAGNVIEVHEHAGEFKEP